MIEKSDCLDLPSLTSITRQSEQDEGIHQYMGTVTIKSMSVVIEMLIQIWIVWTYWLDVPALTADNIGYQSNTFASAHEVTIKSNNLSLMFGSNSLDAPGIEAFIQRSKEKRRVNI